MNVRDIQRRLDGYGYSPGTIDGDMGPKTYGALFAFVGSNHSPDLPGDLGAAAEKYFPSAAIVTPLRIGHALARWAVETRGFRDMEENLSYAAPRICAVWPRRFPTLTCAAPFERNPEALANKVYGGRNGNTRPGDGWRFRGRGPTGLTFRDNYADAQALTGIDVVSDPDLVATADTGLMVACAYWSKRNINQSADLNDLKAVCLKVNGGQFGLDDQRRYLARAMMVLA